MKLRSLALALALFSTAACAKSNDVTPLQQEATALAAFYNQEIGALEQRATDLEKRIVKVRAHPNIADTVRRFNEARGKLGELKAMSQKATGAIAMASGGAKDPPAAKTGSGSDNEAAPDPDPKWKLERLIDEMKDRFQLGIVETTNRLDSVESWIHEAERYVPPMAPPAAPDETPAAPAGDPATQGTDTAPSQ